MWEILSTGASRRNMPAQQVVENAQQLISKKLRIKWNHAPNATLVPSVQFRHISISLLDLNSELLNSW